MNNLTAAVLGLCVALGLALGGWFIGNGFLEARALERSVEVKGLAEREVIADTAIWPLQITVAGNELEPMLAQLERQGEQVRAFLKLRGFDDAEITVSPPSITDRMAQAYGSQDVRLRYSVSQVVTVFTDSIETVRSAGDELLELGKAGIVLNQDQYQYQPQYLFNGLNEIKPAMIEEATRNAREVAQKFAEDSDSTLGKIRRANQGVFSITDRDSTTPHIKKVRVVSTIEYYLSD